MLPMGIQCVCFSAANVATIDIGMLRFSDNSGFRDNGA